MSLTLAARQERALDRFLAACLISLVIAPIIITPGTVSPYSFGKAIWLRNFALLALALGSVRYGADYLRPRSLIQWALLTYGLVLLVASVAGLSPLESLKSGPSRYFGVLDVLLGYGLLCLLSTALNPRDWSLLWKVLLAAALIVCFYGLLQVAGVLPIGDTLHPGRIDSTFGNALYLAVFLMLVVFVAVGVATDAVSVRLRVFGLVVASVAVVTLYYTGSRGPLLALLAGIVAMALLSVVRGMPLTTGLRVQAALLCFLIASLLFLDVTDLLPFERDGGSVLERMGGGVDAIRRTNMRFALSEWQARPLIGWGPGQFYEAMSPEQQGAAVYAEGIPDKVHNEALEHLATSGALGFLAWLGVWAAAGLAILRTRWAFGLGMPFAIAGALAADFFEQLTFFETPCAFLVLILMLAWLVSHAKRPLPA